MKKFAAAILLLSMLLLAACGGAPAGPAPQPTPTPEARPEPTPAPKSIERPALSEPSGVFTDWSKLTEYAAPEEKYTRLSPEPLTELTPGDYGLLLPFEGERKYDLDYSWAAGSQYGLVTAEGCIVLDAVCANIRRGESWVDGTVTYQNYYILERLVYDPESPKANEFNEGWLSFYAACALDGSWCTEFKYDGIHSMREGVACVIDGNANLYEVYGVDGELLYKTADWPARDKISEWSLYNITNLGGDTKWINVNLNGRESDVWEHGYVNAKGELMETEYGSYFEQATAFSEGLAATKVNGKWGYVDEAGNWVIPPSYPYDHEAGMFKNGRALISSNRRSILIDKRGKVLASVDKGLWQAVSEDFVVYCDYDDMMYYDENLQPILIEGRKVDSYCSGGAYAVHGDGVILRRPDGKILHFPDTDFVYYYFGYYLGGIVQEGFTLYDRDGNALFKTVPAYWAQVAKDPVTGEVFVFADRNGYTVYNMQGEKIVSECVSPYPIGGLFRCEDSTTAGYKNAQNEWVFRIRLDSGD